MTAKLITLVLISVSASAIAQIVLKQGMSRTGLDAAINANAWLDVVLWVISNPWVVGGLTLYFAGALVWLFVLAEAEVSMVYPFVGVGFILTMILGRVILGESITLARIAGTFLVAAGVVLIARS